MRKSAWFGFKFILGWMMVMGPEAMAVMTITPQNWTLPDPSPVPYVFGDKTFYYLIKKDAPLANGAFLDPTISSDGNGIDLGKNAGYSKSRSSSGESTVFNKGLADTERFKNAIGVRISTTSPIPIGSVITIQIPGVNPPQGSGPRYIPIAGSDQGVCNDQLCFAKDMYGRVLVQNDQTASGAPYYAASISGQNFTVYFYPNDVCADVSYSTTSLDFCSSGEPTDPGTGAKSLSLIFVIQTVSSNQAISLPSGSPIETSRPVKFSFQSTASTFTCPDLSAVTIKPDDGRVYIDASQFSLTSNAGMADGLKFITVFKRASLNTAPDLSSSFLTANTGVSTSYGNYKNAMYFATGFENSIASNTINYYLGFLIQDAAGIYTPPIARVGTTPTFPPTSLAQQGCTGLGPIATSSVYGFLSSDAKCFIATAAFQSTEAPPVQMLREFRDRVLLTSTPGQAFVSWYYSWSPDAAGWLDDHAWARVPVLLGLSKLEMIAWLCLHPGILVLLGFSGFGLIGLWLIFNRRGNLHVT